MSATLAWASGDGCERRVMGKKAIGIDIGRFHIRAVQMARTPDGLRIEKVFGMQTRRSTDSPVEILRSLTDKHGFDRKAEVVVSLPHHAVFFAEARLDPAEARKLDTANVSTLAESFPIDPDEAVLQPCSAPSPGQADRPTLVAATATGLVEEELELLNGAHFYPVVIDTAVTAACTTVKANHPEARQGIAVLCCVDESLLTLTVIRDGNLLMARNIPLALPRDYDAQTLARQTTETLNREVEITWQKLFGSEPSAEVRLFLICAPTSADALAEAIDDQLNCRTTIVDPCAHIQSPDKTEADFSICVAEGLALRVLSPAPSGTVNFLTPYRAQTRPAVHLARELAICSVFVVAIILVWTAGLFLQRARLETQYEELKTQERELFLQTLPQEKNVVNPVAQLEQKLGDLRNNSELMTSFQPGRIPPTKVLELLCTHSPAGDDLRFDDVSITGDSVRISGHCNSFTAVTNWKRMLESIPGFTVTEDPETTKDPKTGKVAFTLSFATRKAAR